jgi:hypothetical protein
MSAIFSPPGIVIPVLGIRAGSEGLFEPVVGEYGKYLVTRKECQVLKAEHKRLLTFYLKTKKYYIYHRKGSAYKSKVQNPPVAPFPFASDPHTAMRQFVAVRKCYLSFLSAYRLARKCWREEPLPFQLYYGCMRASGSPLADSPVWNRAFGPVYRTDEEKQVLTYLYP